MSWLKLSAKKNRKHDLQVILDAEKYRWNRRSEYITKNVVSEWSGISEGSDSPTTVARIPDFEKNVGFQIFANYAILRNLEKRVCHSFFVRIGYFVKEIPARVFLSF